MKIELKAIKYAAFASEETPCYEAQLWADGVYVADVSNQGHGGCDEVWARDGMGPKLMDVEAWCKSQPKIKSYGMELENSLEMVCGELLDKHLAARDLKRLLKSKVMVGTDKPGQFQQYSWKGLKQIEQKHIDIIKAKHPTAIILNAMTFDKALEVYTAK